MSQGLQDPVLALTCLLDAGLLCGLIVRMLAGFLQMACMRMYRTPTNALACHAAGPRGADREEAVRAGAPPRAEAGVYYSHAVGRSFMLLMPQPNAEDVLVLMTSRPNQVPWVFAL